MDNSNVGRPAVLQQATETQIMELERQFAENDRQYWDDLGKSYGWSADEIQEAWDWFSQKSPTSSDSQSFSQ